MEHTHPPTGPQPGLRARKKASTRRSISDVATRLFLERGYEAVTLADVAAAAEVSVKTIFNHFGSKEELFLDREREIEEAVLAAVRARPAGTTVAAAICALVSENRIATPGQGWAALDDPVMRGFMERFMAIWRDTAALHARSLLGNLRLADRLAAALGEETGLGRDDDRVTAWASLLAAALLRRHEVGVDAILAGQPAAEIERRARALAAELFGRLETAFGDLEARAAAGRAGSPPAEGRP